MVTDGFFIYTPSSIFPPFYVRLRFDIPKPGGSLGTPTRKTFFLTSKGRSTCISACRADSTNATLTIEETSLQNHKQPNNNRENPNSHQGILRCRGPREEGAGAGGSQASLLRDSWTTQPTWEDASVYISGCRLAIGGWAGREGPQERRHWGCCPLSHDGNFHSLERRKEKKGGSLNPPFSDTSPGSQSAEVENDTGE